MAMPTTRRGRFILYRERALRRAKKLRRAVAFPSTDPTRPCHAITRRTFDWRAYGKQVPPTDYNPYPLGPLRTEPELYWRVPPSRGQWGVPFANGSFAFYLARHYSPSVAYDMVFNRRVYSIPTIRQIDVLPWAAPITSVPEGEFYPFEFYPSGRPGYLWHVLNP